MKIETFTLDTEVKVMCLTAKSFPVGIMEAHEKLHSIVPFSNERRYFGISRPEGKGVIVYKAAAGEMTHGEAERLELETFVIESGQYSSVLIQDYMKDIQSIGSAFQKLIALPGIDPQGFCIEWYLNGKDVRCMVRQIR